MPVPVTPVNVSPGTTGSFVDVDVTANVANPGNLCGVILELRASAGGLTCGVRKNGSTDSILIAMPGIGHLYVFVGVDAGDIFEVNSSSSNVQVWLVGEVLASEGGSLTNRVEFTNSTTTTWEDQDISGQTGADTALVAFLILRRDSTSVGNLNVRCNGSTDNRTVSAGATTTGAGSGWGMAVAVDGSEIFESRDAVTGNLGRFGLMGWLKANATGFTNAKDYSTGTTGSYVDTDLSADVPAGNSQVFAQFTGLNGSVGIRNNGYTADDHYADIRQGTGVYTELDSGRVCEQKIETTAADLWLHAYANVPGTTYTEAGSGGAVCGGGATPTWSGTETGAGGATLGGTDAVTVVRSVTAAGGAVTGGSATNQVTASNIGSGTATCGGSATVSGTVSLTGAGGAITGGIATVGVTVSEAGSGGASTGGLAGAGQAITETAAGGVTAGGSATVAVAYSVTTSGGASIEGSATLVVTFEPAASGGAVLGGSGDVQIAYAYIASGGITLTGEAQPSETPTEPWTAIVSLYDHYAEAEALDPMAAAALVDSVALACTLDPMALATSVE